MEEGRMEAWRPRGGGKKALYGRLAETFSLPPRDSKGVTVRWLKSVEEGTVFRVGVVELNKFLAGLVPSQLRKAAFTCKYVAHKKVDRLLAEMGKPGLGFEAGIVPDGTWLYKVARFVDPANVCGVFQVSLTQVPTVQVDSFRVELAKRAVETLVIKSSGLDRQAEVKTALDELAVLQKRQASRQAELDCLVVRGRQLEREVEEGNRAVQVRLMTATVLVYAAGEKKRPEEAMEGDEEKKREIHELYAANDID
jgi:hypothetical protein